MQPVDVPLTAVISYTGFYCVYVKNNCQELKLVRGPGEKLGISVQGGVGSRCGNPLDPTDEGIFISQVCY